MTFVKRREFLIGAGASVVDLVEAGEKSRNRIAETAGRIATFKASLVGA